MGGRMLDACDPTTGKRLWYLPDLIGNRTITGPVAALGMIYVTQGMRQPLLAVRPGDDGRRPRADIVWQFRKARPTAPRRSSAASRLLVTNEGIARCLDALTGRLQWKQRLKGNYRASPLAADGRIYFLNTHGFATVVPRPPITAGWPKTNSTTRRSPRRSSPTAIFLFAAGRALYCLGK